MSRSASIAKPRVAGTHTKRLRGTEHSRCAPQPRWSHGTSGYQNHGCRCQVCRIAWSEKMHAAHLARKADAVIAAKTPALTSWWLDAKPEAFTALVEREQIARMKTSRFGLIQGRPYTTDEVSR